MILGMSTSTFTLVHVIFALAGIGSGLIVVHGMLAAKRLEGWTAIYLASTALTSLTGFLFPVKHLMPSHVIGTISLVVLAIAIVARYAMHMAGRWRGIYVVSAVLAFYFNAFVAVVQAFLKIPALHAMAPTQKEAPFVAAQLVVMAIFIAIGVFGVRRFHAEGLAAHA